MGGSRDAESASTRSSSDCSCCRRLAAAAGRSSAAIALGIAPLAPSILINWAATSPNIVIDSVAVDLKRTNMLHSPPQGGRIEKSAGRYGRLLPAAGVIFRIVQVRDQRLHLADFALLGSDDSVGKPSNTRIT